jgi:hypothetical protein
MTKIIISGSQNVFRTDYAPRVLLRRAFYEYAEQRIHP